MALKSKCTHNSFWTHVFELHNNKHLENLFPSYLDTNVILVHKHQTISNTKHISI